MKKYAKKIQARVKGRRHRFSLKVRGEEISLMLVKTLCGEVKGAKKGLLGRWGGAVRE